jgi:putative CocE/NonD family hydrolase
VPLMAVAESTPWLGSYREWLTHPDRDDYWRHTAINERYSDIDVPALHIAGWNDIFLKGSLENYVGLRDGAGTQRGRDHQRLIVTPYGHSQGHGESAGDLWYGGGAEYVFASRHAATSATAPIDLPRECIEWLDACLKDGPYHEGPPVRLFVMGANRWRDEEHWPLTRAITRRWYLRTDAGLSPEAPGDEAPDTFVFDPLDPVPTAGGQTLLPGGGFFMGPRDRRAIEHRPDVLAYTSEPLQRALEVTGYITVTLHVATSGVDTDFTAALVDVHPDGRALGVVDGILRLRYRDGTARAVFAEPGRVYEIQIDLQATSNVFGVGHRLRVEISSSNFPRFDRNPNTAGAVAETDESRFRVAQQVVFHDADRASFVTLPIIEGGR